MAKRNYWEPVDVPLCSKDISFLLVAVKEYREKLLHEDEKAPDFDAPGNHHDLLMMDHLARILTAAKKKVDDGD